MPFLGLETFCELFPSRTISPSYPILSPVFLASQTRLQPLESPGMTILQTHCCLLPFGKSLHFRAWAWPTCYSVLKMDILKCNLQSQITMVAKAICTKQKRKQTTKNTHKPKQNKTKTLPRVMVKIKVCEQGHHQRSQRM